MEERGTRSIMKKEIQNEEKEKELSNNEEERKEEI